MHLLDKTSTAYFFDFQANANIFVICSNSVEQLRFWCRAVFPSRWLLSRWSFSNNYWPFISIVTNKLKYEYLLLKLKVLLIYIKTNIFFQFNFDFFDFVMKNLIFAVNWITKRSHKKIRKNLLNRKLHR
jgi:hypothetical protein